MTPTPAGTTAAVTSDNGTAQNCWSTTPAPNAVVAPPANPWISARVEPRRLERSRDIPRSSTPPVPTAVAPPPAAVVRGFLPSIQM